jgi:hypothetical protein
MFGMNVKPYKTDSEMFAEHGKIEPCPDEMRCLL